MASLRQHIRRRASFLMTMLCLAAAVGYLVYHEQAQASSGRSAGPAVQRTASEEHGDSAHVGWKVHMLSGLDVTLLAVEKSDATWRFHVKVANPSDKAVIALGPDLPTPSDVSADQTALDHQFVIDVWSPVLTVEYRPLSATSASDQAHPALAGWLILLPGHEVDGWLQVDVTLSAGPLSDHLFYLHDPRPSMRCTDPGDQRTCTPETRYALMIWLI
jgi:hypothetical protein